MFKNPAGGTAPLPPAADAYGLWLGDVTSFFGIKGELGELEFYLRKIPLHQPKVLVASVLSNSPWLPNNLKHEPK